MIKKFFLTFIYIFFVCSCSKPTFNNIESTPDITSYKVMDIKKENNWYFIYFQRNDSIFKVVSYQPSYLGTLNGRYRQIEKGKSYNLILHSYKDAHNWPIGYTGGIQLDGETSVTVEPENGIWDLYHADELAGLYYLKRK